MGAATEGAFRVCWKGAGAVMGRTWYADGSCRKETSSERVSWMLLLLMLLVSGGGETMGERVGESTREGVLVEVLGASWRGSSRASSASRGPLVMRRVRATRPEGERPWVVLRWGLRLILAGAHSACTYVVAATYRRGQVRR